MWLSYKTPEDIWNASRHTCNYIQFSSIITSVNEPEYNVGLLFAFLLSIQKKNNRGVGQQSSLVFTLSMCVWVIQVRESLEVRTFLTRSTADGWHAFINPSRVTQLVVYLVKLIVTPYADETSVIAKFPSFLISYVILCWFQLPAGPRQFERWSVIFLESEIC